MESVKAMDSADDAVNEPQDGVDHSVDGPADDSVDAASEEPTEALEFAKKKKKRKSRPGKTRRAITGFEVEADMTEFYADPPTTPAEYAEEKNLYSADKPIAQRLEEAIQRYRQKRRFDNQKSFMFDKYLALGGIDSSQRMFQGLDAADAKDMNAEEIRQMTSRYAVQRGFAGSKFYDPDEPGDWRVDFPIIVKGFLSRWIPENYPCNSDPHDDNVQAAALIANFLNYLQLHDVCPEYKAQLVTAKAICEVAPVSLGHARDLFQELKGVFNTIAESLYCDGGVFEVYTSPVDDNESLPEQPGAQHVKLNSYNQFLILRLSIMAASNDLKHPIVDLDPQDVRVESTFVETYQVVSIKRRTKREMNMWDKQLAQSDFKDKVQAMGSMVLRPSVIDHAYSNALRPGRVDFSKAPTETFIVDNDILEKVELGMKMRLQVCRLNIGTVFIKNVIDVRVGFDVLLPQSLMLNWKDPSPNDRPAPSIHDIDQNNGHEQTGTNEDDL
ncbi:hypothetical protein PFICI_04200 [Pestalotiopsis fici W106-1]|uniref:Argonaute siRNA chaperone complex subunit Arb1 n=1 Tax=Pestalotiopsis fici (strain W106-1 / CGMCC3.15140) TaxID=1229662 RepID=W3X8I0_PESFW|nr:uncharacterized protein PFICI_04200 [Pestalotiopsis fici W106-1]ETS82324.1 hypothetical protein PFICI_04200 [Pestalotiopsis fici W106-1]